MGTREAKLEDFLEGGVKGLGGECWKWVCPARAGVPDRIIMVEGLVIFVELKTVGVKADPHQVRIHERMRKLGMEVHVLAGYSEVTGFLRQLRDTVLDIRASYASK